MILNNNIKYISYITKYLYSNYIHILYNVNYVYLNIIISMYLTINHQLFQKTLIKNNNVNRPTTGSATTVHGTVVHDNNLSNLQQYASKFQIPTRYNSAVQGYLFSVTYYVGTRRPVMLFRFRISEYRTITIVNDDFNNNVQ